MRPLRPILACTTAIALATAALAPSPATAQMAPVLEGSRVLISMIVQTALSFARTAVQLTYDGIAVDARSGEVTITGLTLHPELDWDSERACSVRIERVTLADGGRFDRIDGLLGLSGVTVPSACLDPGSSTIAAALGFDPIVAETVAIDAAYDVASSALSLDITASLADAATITAAADFDYFYFQNVSIDQEAVADGGEEAIEDAEPLAILSSAEISLVNRGLFESVEPMLNAQLGDLSAVPAIAQAGLMGALSQGSAPTPETVAFVEQVTAELARFVEQKDSIVVTLAPEVPVLLEEELFDDPVAAITALSPRVGALPAARDAVVPLSTVEIGLATPEALSPAERLALGRALLTGEGAPRSREAAIALLEGLSSAGDSDAALLLAEAYAAGRVYDRAYASALQAMAGGKAAAVPMADAMEAKLDLAAIIAAQEAVGGIAEDAALIEAGDLGGMRALAERLVAGLNGPRHYADALYWASLAAAGGDRAAAALIGRLDRRFLARDEETATWGEVSAAVSARALATWSAGLAARVTPQP
ncbi:MAG: hypothetical protein AAF675_10955 [Pseudomonadota bacterium]